MKAETAVKYRSLLESQRDALKRALNRHDEDLRHVHTTSDIAGGDHAAEVEELGLESRIVESEELLLAKIEHALDRIERGVYGNCEACGVEIPEPRLEAKPSVSLCVKCQEEKESRTVSG